MDAYPTYSVEAPAINQQAVESVLKRVQSFVAKFETILCIF